ncbi:MAG: Brp/Blh family beta-carotene 15,15'-dioxygenase [Porticoccaceae bacterium]
MTSWDILAIAAILLVGVPHGGFDGAIARHIGWPKGVIPWLGFHLAYIALAILVLVLWWLLPLPSLVIFLGLSALHFGASDIADIGTDWLPWLAHGGLVCLAIPNFQPALVAPIFAILIGSENSAILLNGISALFAPWLISVLAYCVYAYFQSQYRLPAATLLLFIGLTYLLPPLISFSLYFCLWHSRGHVMRLWRSLNYADRRHTAREAIFYTLIAWASLAIIYYFLQGNAVQSLTKLTFIGLAALTLPHMLLVDYASRTMHRGATL